MTEEEEEEEEEEEGGGETGVGGRTMILCRELGCWR